jgi:hypothetical protein
MAMANSHPDELAFGGSHPSPERRGQTVTSRFETRWKQMHDYRVARRRAINDKADGVFRSGLLLLSAIMQ